MLSVVSLFIEISSVISKYECCKPEKIVICANILNQMEKNGIIILFRMMWYIEVLDEIEMNMCFHNDLERYNVVT
jgi:hypothetical protein